MRAIDRPSTSRGRRVRRCATWSLCLLLATGHALRARADETDDAVGWGKDGDASHKSDDAVGWGGRTAETASTSDDAVGWGEDGDAEGTTQDATSEEEPSPFSLGGRYRLRGGLFTERLVEQPLSQARNLLGLWLQYSVDFGLGGERAALKLLASGRGEYDAAYWIDRERFDAPTLETYQWQLLLEETFLSFAWGPLELRVGRQLMPLGQGEVLSTLDVLNARDLRDPVLTEVEDIALPVTATRLGLSLGGHRLQGYVVHESYFGLRAPPLGTLSPLRRLLEDARLGDRTIRHSDRPRGFESDAWRWLGRYGYSGDGVDVDFYAGSVLDSLGVVQLPQPDELAESELTLHYFHPRYPLVGHSGALAVDELLLRWELAAEIDRPHVVRHIDTDLLRLETERHTQLAALVGLTHFGLGDANVGLEVMRALVVDNPARLAGSDRELLLPTESTNVALRYTHSFLRERLQLRLVLVLIGVVDFNAFVGRGELEYALDDALRIALGYGAFFPNHDDFGLFYGFEHNDRLYLDLRWDFALL